jgi:hypothetical protein
MAVDSSTAALVTAGCVCLALCRYDLACDDPALLGGSSASPARNKK